MNEQNLSHSVFFTLKDASDKAVENLINECHSYLKDLPGIIYFSAGSRSPENNGDVNIKDFHVGLTVVFSNMSYYDQYQIAEQHTALVDRNKANWALVRVFDMYAS
ncbi:MAG: Dabb family protein [Actinomycetota bacterium]